METKIIKSKKRVNWKFPCKGISSINNTIVGFSSYGKGTVINIGECEYYKLYDIKENWNMDTFKSAIQDYLIFKKNSLNEQILKINNLIKVTCTEVSRCELFHLRLSFLAYRHGLWTSCSESAA